ncbi:hypothetical protein [Luedemannella helvata]|uniref:Uncharacterized protein n=1 Tax=Luedemannella helvata TaxID=349315 RepID=A0ABP4X470_9ACTN
MGSSITLAEATGDEGQTAVVAAAAVVAGATTTGSGNGKDECEPEDLIAEVAQQIVDELGYEGINEKVTEGQWNFIKENGRGLERAQGHVVHQAVADRLAEKYKIKIGKNLVPRFIYIRSIGPDYWDLLKEVYVELTTPGQVAGHKAKKDKGPRYGTCRYATYNLPKK